MRILKLFVFSFIVFLSGQVKTQTISLDSVQACIGDTAGISIKIPPIDSAGAITLFISYDTIKLNFIDLTNITPLATGTIFNDMHTGGITGPRLGKIAISWVANGPGVNFSAGVFAILKFKVISGSSDVNFLNSCEIVNYSAQTLNFTYINGSLSVPTIPVISTQPMPLSISTTQTGVFIVNKINADSISWQMKQGNVWISIQNNNTFQGVNRDSLYISHPGINLNGVYFRCIVRNLCSFLLSDSVLLNVELAVNNIELQGFKYYPDPFCDNISLDFPSLSFLEKINIFQIDGKIVKKIIINDQSTHFYIPQLENLEKGCYFIEFISGNKDQFKIRKTFKMIKN